MAALLSREIFQVDLALPDMPEAKSIRGIGMSDWPLLAEQLGKKFDYTNTFYHQAPQFDVTQPDSNDFGRYDFILSSEVMEHIPPPVERGFENLCRLLKPDGILILTVPYGIEGRTCEHFPDLNEYALAAPGGAPVLVNRRKDGVLETFENLTFHGGPGSTLETRIFTQESLRVLLLGCGFSDVHISSENIPEFGVEHGENWSLPIAARKGRFVPPTAELAAAYREQTEALRAAHADLAALESDYARYVEHHVSSENSMKSDLSQRTEWAQGLERQLQDRTNWALSLVEQGKESEAALDVARASEADAWRAAQALERELVEVRGAKTSLERKLWTRIGRRIRAI
jgi:SAM-dependent methyltransferase